MTQHLQPAIHMRPGHVYRREQLEALSSSVDRELKNLVAQGALLKAGAGLYFLPKQTAFGVAPPAEDALVEAFLKGDDYLLVSPNLYNSLGVGTTQLYNTTIVYNHKRHGQFKLAGRPFEFRMKPRFPKSLSEEFLLVDLVNNLKTLAEDRVQVLDNVQNKAYSLDRKRLLSMAQIYGKVATKRFFVDALQP